MYKHITVSGADAVEFLQGQLTQDVNQLERTGKLSAALCNPKGRVICTLTLVQKPDSIGLLIPATIAEAVLKRLTMYRMLHRSGSRGTNRKSRQKQATHASLRSG
ncbi:MAG: hypothetical protein ACKVJN_18090 [Woeseiales bacterium]